ncbi:PepSY-like domain-containing protein [Barnesiella viscericola]|uniref:PepSY-like domain-containing protein n=1 Tax=Barnesiella viscericola TaxID=397865 RepID=UPI0025A390C4|nr:PepSY-like domain-containing protein [Barnesiella viscericola]MDM8267713.1 PepSY-like domain-containing protein [Barnesiella viscericola]
MKNYLYLIVLFATIAWGIGPGRGENKTTDRKISMSELPQPARQLLRTYFPGARVLQCVHSRTWDEYGVKVSGGYDLEFDRKGRWEEIDSHDTPLDSSLVKLLPAPVAEYLEQHYPGAKVESMEQRKNVYKITLVRPETHLYFSKTGEFVKERND